MRSKAWALLGVAGAVYASSGLADESRARAHLLRAAAGSSPRPKECRPDAAAEPSGGHTLWDAARQPRLLRYCNALAKGYSRLREDPEQALQAAATAARAQPAQVAPWVLKALALVTLGRAGESFDTFRRALAKAPDLRLSPEALHGYARAAAASGHRGDALSAYRRLVPMAGLLTGPGASDSVYVEAAALVMLTTPGELQEAVAYLNEARRRNAVPILRPYILAALSLTLDRQGRTEEARGVAAEARGGADAMSAAPQPRSNDVTLPTLDSLELLPMKAMLAASEDRELAQEYFRDFVEGAPADHPWLAHARAKLAAKAR
jgi:tetratricopeptide (TPR) repeat protein